jgi:hypothetical protein
VANDLERKTDATRLVAPVPVRNQQAAGKQTTVKDGGAGSIVRTRILALRGEGRAATPEGIRLLTTLVDRPDAIFATECFLATGEIARDAPVARWLPVVEALAEDARTAYDAAIRARKKDDSLDGVLTRARTGLAATTQADTDDGPDPRSRLIAERAAKRGDSDTAITALTALLGAGDAAAIARAECLIQTGDVETPLRLGHWADQLAGLPEDARRGYARALTARRSPLTLNAAITQLRATASRDANAVAIVRAYRTAGQPMQPQAIEQLAVLLTIHDRDVDTVEQRLAGTSVGVVALDGGATIANADSSGALARLPPDLASAYRAALASLEAKPKRTTPNPPRQQDRQQVTQRTTEIPARPTAGGSDGSQGVSAAFRFGPDDFAGVAPADRNATLGKLLLIKVGVPEALATWIAFCSGQPPDKVRDLLDAQADFEGTTTLGRTRPIARRPRQGGAGYKGFQIVDAGGARMSAEEIDSALTSRGWVEVDLDLGYYKDHVAPLLEDAGAGAWVRADLIALDLQRQIDALEVQEHEAFARTGKHDQALLSRLLALRGMRAEYATYGADLRSGKTSLTNEMGKFAAEIQRLDGMLASNKQQLVDARRRLVEDQERQRKEQVYQPQRPATGVTPTFQNAPQTRPSSEILREIRELEADTQELEAAKGNAEQMMGAGDPFPATQIQRQVNDRKRRYETPDGRFQFRSDLQATWNAVDGALASASSRIYAAGGGIAEYGGWGLSFLTGEPWFAGVGAGLSTRAYSAAAQIDAYAADRTARAEEVLGKTGTMVVQLVTSTAVFALMLGPVAVAGGALGAAAIGGTYGATAGSVSAMALSGALMASDKGGGEMLKGGAVMGAMGVFGGLGSSTLKRIASAFLAGAAGDAASQFDFTAAYSAYQQSGSTTDFLAAGGKNIDVQRVFANGLLGAALVSRVAKRPDQSGTILQVGDDYYRADGTRLERPPARTDQVVRINPEELTSIQRKQTAPEVTQDLIARARDRSDALTAETATGKALDGEIRALEAKRNPADAEKLAELQQRRDASTARSELLVAAREGKPIPRTLIEQAGGQVPLGYAESAGGDFLPAPGLAATQTATLATRRVKAEEQAGEYQAELDAMNKASRDLLALQRTANPNPGRLAELRQVLAARSDQAAQAKVRFERTAAGETTQTTQTRTQTTPATPTPATPTTTTPTAKRTVVVDPAAEPLGTPGAQGIVYPTTDGMAVKLVDGVGTIETALDGARLPTRYGGLGNGEIVTVKHGDLITEGVLMPLVDGMPLADAKVATASQLAAFKTAMANAEADGVLMGDLNPRNILLRKDGGIAVIDAPAMTFDRFAAFTRQVLGDKATPELIAKDWAAARDNFKWRVDNTVRELEALIAGATPTKIPPPVTTTSPTPWWSYSDNNVVLDPKNFRETPTYLAEGSMADAFDHKGTWVMKTLQPGNGYGQLAPELGARLLAKLASLNTRANAILTAAGLGTVPQTRALSPIKGADGVTTPRPVLVQRKVIGARKLGELDGVEQTNARIAIKKAIDKLSADLDLPLTQNEFRQQKLGTVKKFTIDENPENFFINPDGTLQWIDPFFPPDAEMIQANPEILDQP